MTNGAARFGRLDGGGCSCVGSLCCCSSKENRYGSPRSCRLTDSAAYANVMLVLPRIAHPHIGMWRFPIRPRLIRQAWSVGPRWFPYLAQQHRLAHKVACTTAQADEAAHPFNPRRGM